MPYVLAAAAVVAATALYLLRFRSPYRRRAKVAVHTQDSRTITGILEAVYPSGLVLRTPRIQLEAQPQPIEQELEGEVLIERSNISFVQRLP